MEVVGISRKVLELMRNYWDMEDREIIDEIMVQLNHFTFRRSSMSYQYLIDAIYIVVKDRNTMRDLKRYVYFPIAQRYNTRPENVQWTLSKLIDLMYINTPSEVIYDYFKFYMDEKPTLKFFIISVARNVYEGIHDKYIYY